MKISCKVRATVDVLLMATFTFLAVTGFNRYFRDPGRGARGLGSGFRLHPYVGFIFIALVIIHLTLGYRSVPSLFRAGMRGRLRSLARAIVDVSLIVVFVIMAVTGVWLYVSSPGGSVLKLHTYGAFVMTGLVVTHVILGWKSFTGVLRAASR